MRNLDIWIITLITAIVFIMGIAYYKIFDAVVNAAAFIISLAIIFLILILVIIFSQKELKNNFIQKPKVENAKIDESKTDAKKTSIKKSRVKKIVNF